MGWKCESVRGGRRGMPTRCESRAPTVQPLQQTPMTLPNPRRAAQRTHQHPSQTAGATQDIAPGQKRAPRQHEPGPVDLWPLLLQRRESLPGLGVGLGRGQDQQKKLRFFGMLCSKTPCAPSAGFEGCNQACGHCFFMPNPGGPLLFWFD